MDLLTAECPRCATVRAQGESTCLICGYEFMSPVAEVSTPIEWVIAREVSTEFEAELMAGRLRSYDIPACVLSQVDRSRGLTVGLLAIAKVFVPKEQLDAARAILNRDDTDLLPDVGRND